MLALDPYYEMFPSSYRRPYPYWHRGFGAALPFRTSDSYQIAYETIRNEFNSGSGEYALNTYQDARDAFLRQAGMVRASGNGSVALARLRTDGSRVVIATFSTYANGPTPNFPKEMIGPRGTPETPPVIDPTASTASITITPSGLSTGAKIAIGVGAGVVVAGLGAFFFARRR